MHFFSGNAMFKTDVSLAEFMRIALDPANADRRLQRIDGAIIEAVSNNKASESASNMIIFLGGFVKPHKLGRVTGSDGGYTISGEQYIPDLRLRQLSTPAAQYNRGISQYRAGFGRRSSFAG